MNDTTMSDERRAAAAAETGNEGPPILFLHGVDRHYPKAT